MLLMGRLTNTQAHVRNLSYVSNFRWVFPPLLISRLPCIVKVSLFVLQLPVHSCRKRRRYSASLKWWEYSVTCVKLYLYYIIARLLSPTAIWRYTHKYIPSYYFSFFMKHQIYIIPRRSPTRNTCSCSTWTSPKKLALQPLLINLFLRNLYRCHFLTHGIRHCEIYYIQFLQYKLWCL